MTAHTIHDVSPHTPTQEEYLGDGLYVSFDGFQYCLRAPRIEGDHLVFLEPCVATAFIDYMKRSRLF